jgi:replicative DNA helicase
VDINTLTSAKEQLKEYKYFIDDAAGLTAEALADRAVTRSRKVDTRLVIIDYLQLLKTEKGHTRDVEIGEITKTLKTLAKTLRCPVVIGSQLNRQCEVRGASSGNYKPLLSDLRESGNIEQDSDIILAVHREYRYSKLRPSEADIIILKNRNGPIGEVVMGFSDAQTMFYDNRDNGGI